MHTDWHNYICYVKTTKCTMCVLYGFQQITDNFHHHSHETLQRQPEQCLRTMVSTCSDERVTSNVDLYSVGDWWQPRLLFGGVFVSQLQRMSSNPLCNVQ